MSDSVAGVVLAAGRGERLRPLTIRRPKALCPVANVPLVDLAIGRLKGLVGGVAVNVHHGRAAMEAHLAGRVHLSIEADEPLGTAGGVARLKPWLDGRAALVVNADAWCPGRLDELLDGWDGERMRLLVAGEDRLGPRSRVAGALLPWSAIEPLDPVPSGLWEVCWSQALETGRVEVARHDGPFVDCGTPADYLAANLQASGGASVVGVGAVVEGELVRSVVWAGGTVRRGERLVDAVRDDRGGTVFVRGAWPPSA
jgi:NDP-sugar pyrophosphorylase family protein